MAITRSADAPKPRHLSCADIEHALAQRIGFRKYVICPNVSWGLGFLHELDLLVLTPGDWAWEIEIKISVSDLKRDVKKKRHHKSNRLRCLFFAVPKRMLAAAAEWAPPEAGIWTVDEQTLFCELQRQPQKNEDARKFTAQEKFDLVRLASMRLWDRRPFPTADADLIDAVIDIMADKSEIVIGRNDLGSFVRAVVRDGTEYRNCTIAISDYQLQQGYSKKKILVDSIRECYTRLKERTGDYNGSSKESGETRTETGEEGHPGEEG